jgi:hypothetical protein
MDSKKALLDDALEQYQEGGPYSHGAPHSAGEMVQDIIEDMRDEELLDEDFRADVTVVCAVGGAALVKAEIELVPGENSEVVYLFVEDDELQFPDEYRVYIRVVENPTEWLGHQLDIKKLVAELTGKPVEEPETSPRCPYCGWTTKCSDSEYDQDGYSSVTWECPKCGGKVGTVHIPPYKEDDDE